MVYLIIIICERSKPKKNDVYIQKNTPDNAENLEMLFSEMYILRIKGGGGHPDPPLDLRLVSSLHAS